MSERIKALLSAAAGPTGQGDEGWHRAGSDRLYFSDPRDFNSAGQVDVLRPTDKNPEVDYVRVELWVSPERAAEVVALVTGETISVETRLRYSIRSELCESMHVPLVPKAAVTTLPTGAVASQPLPVVEVAAGGDFDPEAASLAVELAQLASEQAQDDAGDAGEGNDAGEGQDDEEAEAA